MSETPHDLEAERAILGGLLVDPQGMDRLPATLRADHFFREAHGLVFTAMGELHASGKPVEFLSVTQALGPDGLEAAGGKAYISNLTDGVPRSINLTFYGQRVLEKATLRAVIRAARQIIAEAQAFDAEADRVLEAGEQALWTLGQATVPGELVKAEQLGKDLWPVLEQLHQARKGLSGIPSGLIDLDAQTRGWQAGDLIILGARPSQGKSALALQMALAACAAGPVAFFSVEMSKESLGLRAVTALGQVDGQRLMSGFLSDADYARVGDGLSQFGNLALWVDDTASLTVAQLRSKARRLKAQQHGLALIVVDYLQLMVPSERKRQAENRNLELGEMSRALKLVAKELSVPILALSQLNRGVEQRAEKKPTLGDLRESGSLEQDADLVLLLWRPGYYDRNQPPTAAEVIVAKHRNGPTGVVTLTWLGDQMRFVNWSAQ